MRSLRPIGEFLIIEPVIHPDEVQHKGITLFAGSSAVVEMSEGVVRRISTNCVVDARVGESVLYASYAGTIVTVEGVQLLILKPKDILAVIEDVPEDVAFTVDTFNEALHANT